MLLYIQERTTNKEIEMNYNEIAKNFEEIRKVNYLGIRSLCQDEKYDIGDYTRNSKDWNFENDCESENELPGISTIEIIMSETPEEIINDIENKIEIMNDYNAGRRIVLIGSLNKYYGDDQHEAVLERGIVLAIIK